MQIAFPKPIIISYIIYKQVTYIWRRPNCYFLEVKELNFTHILHWKKKCMPATTSLTKWLTILSSQNDIIYNNNYISAIWSDKSPKSYLVIKIWQFFLKNTSNL